jgi:hypothetical protein
VGSRTTDKLKEIEQLRGSLSQKLGEIERRFPLAGFGRKAAAMLAGGSAGGTAVAFALRSRRRRKGRKQTAAQPPSVTVNVFPSGAAWIAAAGVAAWAASRLYEAHNRRKSGHADDTFRPAVVKTMPEPGRQTSAGT